jgi:hypothetical protein
VEVELHIKVVQDQDQEFTKVELSRAEPINQQAKVDIINLETQELTNQEHQVHTNQEHTKHLRILLLTSQETIETPQQGLTLAVLILVDLILVEQATVTPRNDL